ncbi:MAG: hypothetical protein ABW214_04950 [Terrimicrobiaceae bacterium]
MKTASETRSPGTSLAAAQTGDPAYQAFRILQAGFVAAPILAGLDKFFNILVNWQQYLAPFVGNLIAPGSLHGRCGSDRDRPRHRGGRQASSVRSTTPAEEGLIVILTR